MRKNRRYCETRKEIFLFLAPSFSLVKKHSVIDSHLHNSTDHARYKIVTSHFLLSSSI